MRGPGLQQNHYPITQEAFAANLPVLSYFRNAYVDYSHSFSCNIFLLSPTINRALTHTWNNLLSSWDQWTRKKGKYYKRLHISMIPLFRRFFPNYKESLHKTQVLYSSRPKIIPLQSLTCFYFLFASRQKPLTSDWSLPLLLLSQCWETAHWTQLSASVCKRSSTIESHLFPLWSFLISPTWTDSNTVISIIYTFILWGLSKQICPW